MADLVRVIGVFVSSIYDRQRFGNQNDNSTYKPNHTNQQFTNLIILTNNLETFQQSQRSKQKRQTTCYVREHGWCFEQHDCTHSRRGTSISPGDRVHVSQD